jgi:hypothetical protein
MKNAYQRGATSAPAILSEEQLPRDVFSSSSSRHTSSSGPIRIGEEQVRHSTTIDLGDGMRIAPTNATCMAVVDEAAWVCMETRRWSCRISLAAATSSRSWPWACLATPLVPVGCPTSRSRQASHRGSTNERCRHWCHPSHVGSLDVSPTKVERTLGPGRCRL